jgi:hypothetical protein
VRQGHLPLWNPYQYLGSPFLSNPQTAVFYPLTLLFYVLPIPIAYSWSLVLHLFVAGSAFYLFARKSLNLEPMPSVFGALPFAFSGFFAGQAGHLNQFSAAAWLPLLVCSLDLVAVRPTPRRVGVAAIVVGVQLLAGHPQESYMSLLIASVFVAARLATGSWRRLPGVGLGALGALALGVGLAAVQLLATAELTAASTRAGGLQYEEASFLSLPPWFVPWGLLPGYFWNTVDNTEYLGYVGVLPLVAAMAGLLAARRWAVLPAALVAGIGFSLSMGDWLPVYRLFFDHVPLFDRFRVPARWLLMYEFGTAALAAIGANWAWTTGQRRREQPAWAWLFRGILVAVLLYLALGWAPQTAHPVPRRLIAVWLVLTGFGAVCLLIASAAPRWRSITLAGVLVVAAIELWLAPATLTYTQGVPPDAFAAVRDTVQFLHNAPEGRVITLALDHYELSDGAPVRQRLSWLEPSALMAYQAALKRNEILAPNLGTVFHVRQADGYDGGVLPTESFVQLSHLLMPESSVRRDGVWWGSLEYVPSPRLLDLLGVRYVLAGRLRDASVDGVPYDRAIDISLARGISHELQRLPQVAVRTAGLVTSYDGPELTPGTEVARMVLADSVGRIEEFPIRLGIETDYEHARQPEGQPRRLPRWLVNDAWDFETRFQPGIGVPSRITLRGMAPGALHVKAITLLTADGAVHPLVLDDRLERTALAQLKVYELRDSLPQAYAVFGSQVAEPERTLQRLADPAFDPRRQVVLEPGGTARALSGDGAATPASVERPQAERILARASLSQDGYLVITEAGGPGWRASVDGQPAELLRANGIFQAVWLPAGEHVVELMYDPPSLRLGLAVSGTSLLFILGLLRLAGPEIGRGYNPPVMRERHR